MEEQPSQFLPSPLEIEALIDRNELETLASLLQQFHPADIADVLEYISAEKAIIAFGLLPAFEASEVLDEANDDLTSELIEQVDDEKLADLLEVLPMDDAAELLDDLPDETSEKLLQLMEPEEQRDVRRILNYPDESAGRLMNQDVAVLRANWTVSQAFDYLRALKDTETLHYLYVVDVVGRLIGIVPIRMLILAQADALIGKIATDEIEHVNVLTDQEEVADIIAKYDYTALPIVDDQDRLLGVITVDDVLDILEEEITEDIQQLGGSAPLEQPYFSVSTLTMVRKRIGWLLLLFFASLLSGSVVALFAGRISNAVMAMLTIFITLVIGTGGNAGSQTVATIIRAIAVDEVRLSDLGRALRRELAVGVIMGLLLGMAAFAFASLYALARPSTLPSGIVPSQIGLVVACTLPAVVIWSNAIATIIPVMAQRYKIDPTVVSAPMITTIVDATGLLIYFSLAMLILG